MTVIPPTNGQPAPAIRFQPVNMTFDVHQVALTDGHGALVTFSGPTGIFGVFLNVDACRALAGKLRAASSGLTLPAGATVDEEPSA